MTSCPCSIRCLARLSPRKPAPPQISMRLRSVPTIATPSSCVLAQVACTVDVTFQGSAEGTVAAHVEAETSHLPAYDGTAVLTAIRDGDQAPYDQESRPAGAALSIRVMRPMHSLAIGIVAVRHPCWPAGDRPGRFHSPASGWIFRRRRWSVRRWRATRRGWSCHCPGWRAEPCLWSGFCESRPHWWACRQNAAPRRPAAGYAGHGRPDRRAAVGAGNRFRDVPGRIRRRWRRPTPGGSGYSTRSQPCPDQSCWLNLPCHHLPYHVGHAFDGCLRDHLPGTAFRRNLSRNAGCPSATGVERAGAEVYSVVTR